MKPVKLLIIILLVLCLLIAIPTAAKIIFYFVLGMLIYQFIKWLAK